MADPVDDLLLTKEQSVLETYFYALGQFSFDKAKETVEKERDAFHKSHQPSAVYSSFLTALSQLSTAERNYTALMFLVPKGFLRKDSSLKAMYETLKAEFQRLEGRSDCISPLPSPILGHTPPVMSSQGSILSASPTPTFVSFISNITGSSPSTSQSSESSCNAPKHLMEILDRLAGHISSHLVYFVTARLDMMNFYNKLHAASLVHFIKYEELLTGINEIISHALKHFHHPFLTPLKSAFNFECEILLKLLEAQYTLQKWQFLPSLLHLHEAHTKLGSWAATTLSKETRRQYAVITRPTQPPILYQWLTKLKALLVSKFTLYFHDILSRQTSVPEMKSLCSKASTDLYQKMVNFQRKTDALCLAIVLDTFGLENYKGHGYHHPEKYFEPPKGLDSYPAIICYPNEKPSQHWPNVIMIINDKSRDSENVEWIFDKQVNTTYYWIRVEPKMTVTAIFESKKSERDTGIISFLQEFSSQLRCNRVFATLKSGTKT